MRLYAEGDRDLDTLAVGISEVLLARFMADSHELPDTLLLRAVPR